MYPFSKMEMIMTGPKDSSCAIIMWSSTCVKIVGSMKNPGGEEGEEGGRRGERREGGWRGRMVWERKMRSREGGKKGENGEGGGRRMMKMEEGEKGWKGGRTEGEGQEEDDPDIPVSADLASPPSCLHTPTWLPPSHRRHSTSAVSPDGT